MSTFKIGQRVRFIGGKSIAAGDFSKIKVPIGSLGTVANVPCQNTAVLFDLYRSEHTTGVYNCEEHRIEPVDDEADFKRFMERVTTPIPELQGLPLELQP